MKRRLLSAFLAVMMVLTMAPVAFAADGDAEKTAGSNDSAVAKIGESTYDTLKNAFAAVQNDETIVLQKNVSIATSSAVSLPEGVKATLDLNGHTISGKANSKGMVNVSGTLTIVDATKKGIIKSTSSSTSYPPIRVEASGKLFANDVTVKGTILAYGDATFTTGTFEGITVYANTDKDVTLVVGTENGTPNDVTVGAVRFKETTKGKINACLYSGISTATLDNYVAITTNLVACNTLFTKDSTTQCDIKSEATVIGDTTYYRYVAITDEDAQAIVTEAGGRVHKFAKATLAISQAPAGSTVKLLSDVTLYGGTVIPGQSNITIDLNGKTWAYSYAGANNAFSFEDQKCSKATVKNGTITYDAKTSAIMVKRGANVTFENVSINVSDKGTFAIEVGEQKVDRDALSNSVTINNADNCEIKAPLAGIAVFNHHKADGTGTATINVNGGKVIGGWYGIAGNGQVGQTGTIINVNGGEISAEQADGAAIYHPQNGKVNITGGVVTGAQGIQMCAGELTVSGDAKIAATGSDNSANKTGDGLIDDGAAISIVDRAYPGGTPSATITGGYFKSADGVNAVQAYTWSNNTKSAWAQSAAPMSITGGYFTTDPTDYCAVGLTGISTGREDYPYTVGTLPANTENKIDAATDTGNNAVNADAITNPEDRNAAQNAAKNVKFEEAVADKNEITETDKQRGLTALANENKVQVDSNGKIQGNTTVTIVKEVFLDIAVTDFKVQGFEDKDVSVTMDITPKYNLIATTDKDHRTAENSVTLETKSLTVSEATKVSVTIPAFANKKVYIDHANGKNLYVATADENGKIEFTTNGFSPFTFALSNPNVVAEVNGNAYTSFQDAVNAVANGGTIDIVGGTSYTATINSGDSKTFTVKNTLGSDITVKVNNDSKTVGKNNGTQSFTYTKPSSGGSSGGSSSGKTTFKVTTSAVNNGGVNASPSNAEKGATITITLSPDKGYKLDKLTVTDGSGKTVSTVKKSDTVYTFTMPASAVKVGVSYVKATETPSKTKFNDVSANDWFASAVDYVTGKGMMNGTADNTFSPKANTTRGMVVTVLYRLENQPSTSAASFTDVASGAYYANAVAWANANGIVSGYGSGKFGPNGKVTREQLAAILYRYAQYKKYDVSVGEDTNILSYDDAQSISSYAIPAIQWACGAGVVTGKSGSKLDPKGNATRAEVAAMLMRFCENVK